MNERDWLGELTEAIGDDAAQTQAATPGGGEVGDVAAKGPGRDLEGWAEELAEAFGDQLGTGAHAPAHAAPPAAPVDSPPTPAATVAPPPSPPAPVAAPAPAAVAPAPAPAAAPPSPAVLERLARLEAILDADLDKLGPAVLADSIAGLDAQVRAIQDRLAQLDGSLGAVPQAAPGGDALLGRLDDLTRRLDAIAAGRERDGGKVVVDADQFARTLSSLGRRIVALEKLHATTVAMDERAEQRMRDLVERLDRLTTGLLG